MTASLTAVFIPVLFMGGIVGRLLHEFAVTIGVAILVSGFVSISLTPMLCSRFLKPPHAQRHGCVYNAIEWMFRLWLKVYDRTLTRRARLPRRDAGRVGGAARRHRSICSCSCRRVSCRARIRDASTSAPKRMQGICFDDMVRHQSEVAAIVVERSERRRLHQQHRSGPRRQRRRHQHGTHGRRSQAASRAQAVGRPGDCGAASRSWRKIPGIRVFMVNQPPINLGGTAGRAQPLSVHAAGHRHRRAVRVGAEA